MNNNRYRRIFSKRLGMLVAVAETSMAQGKGSGGVPGSGARVGRATSDSHVAGSAMTPACRASGVTRLAVAVGAILGISAQAFAADECGVEAAGADTITCTDPTYSAIEYSDSNGLTLTLDNSAMAITP